MTHTQMDPAYVAASNKKCSLTVPLAVLGEVDAPVFDALTTALAVQWPDESDVDPYDFDEITVEDGEIYFADEDRLEQASYDIEHDIDNVGLVEDESTWGTELQHLGAKRETKRRRRVA